MITQLAKLTVRPCKQVDGWKGGWVRSGPRTRVVCSAAVVLQVVGLLSSTTTFSSRHTSDILARTLGRRGFGSTPVAQPACCPSSQTLPLPSVAAVERGINLPLPLSLSLPRQNTPKHIPKTPQQNTPAQHTQPLINPTWPSVRRPSSSRLSRMLNTSACAFSTSSNSSTLYGRRRTCAHTATADGRHTRQQQHTRNTYARGVSHG